MNELQIFNNPEFGEIRIVTVNNEPWFVGRDVAAVLGYSNTRDAVDRHVDSAVFRPLSHPKAARPSAC